MYFGAGNENSGNLKGMGVVLLDKCDRVIKFEECYDIGTPKTYEEFQRKFAGIENNRLKERII